MVYHWIHAAGGDSKEQARFPELAEITQIVTPVRLRYDSHSQALCFYETSHHCMTEGRVVVLIPGHNRAVLFHPMFKQCLKNALDWLEK